MKYRLTMTLPAAALFAAVASPAMADTSGNMAPALAASAGSTDIVLTADLREASANTEVVIETTPGAVDTTTGYSIAASSDAASSTDLLAIASTLSASEVAAAANATAAAAAVTGGGGGREDSYTVLMSQDSFFGFYPSFNGLLPIAENVDFSFYGILWTTDAFGTAEGADLWTEFGVGLNFIAADGNLSIKPQIGLTNGALLSRGVRDEVTELPTGTGGNFADGIVPSLTIVYSDDKFEGEFYGGYYAALRNRNDPGANDFLHTWINGGYKATPNFSLGAHYEILSLARTQGGQAFRIYQWLGPYVQFSTGNGFFARFTAGADIEDGADGDFYKLTAGFSF